MSWVNVAPDAKFAALQAGTIDATTQFYYLHHVAENVFGKDMGFPRLSEIGFNPYGNTFFFNTTYVKTHPDIVKAFVKVTQQAYAACLQNPKPCTDSVSAATSQSPQVLASSWDLVAELVRTKSTDHLIGWLDPRRMQDDLNPVKEYSVQMIRRRRPLSVTTISMRQSRSHNNIKRPLSDTLRPAIGLRPFATELANRLALASQTDSIRVISLKRLPVATTDKESRNTLSVSQLTPFVAKAFK